MKATGPQRAQISMLLDRAGDKIKEHYALFVDPHDPDLSAEHAEKAIKDLEEHVKKAKQDDLGCGCGFLLALGIVGLVLLVLWWIDGVQLVL